MLPMMCGLVCLAIAAPVLGAGDTLDGDYTGKRVLTKGQGGPRCPAEDDVSVTIRGGALTITDSTLRNFSLGFDPRPDGSFGEIYSDAGGATVSIRGRIVGGVLDADVTNSSSRCEHHWHLTKKR
jgi:hypothetical protein